MNKSKFGFFLFCAVVCAGIVFSSINCAGTGTMGGSVGMNITDQPVWGPTGYDHADFYYIPDIDSYYSVSDHQYIYREGSDWKHAAALPASYGSFDPYTSYKVVINKDKPYQNNDTHKTQYSNFRGVKDQPTIRDSKDPKYFVNKDHPQHDTWSKQQQQ